MSPEGPPRRERREKASLNSESSLNPHHSPKIFSADMPIDAYGRVGVGGDLSPEILREAYEEGIFPWYETAPVEWFSPHERMVLVPRDFYVARTLRRWVRQDGIQLCHSADLAFSRVIRACAEAKRSYGGGTWINAEMIRAYEELHRRGLAHSIEIWAPKTQGQAEESSDKNSTKPTDPLSVSKRGNHEKVSEMIEDEALSKETSKVSLERTQEMTHKMTLVGGLYGVSLGGMFFGESMFSQQTNVSKLALWLLCCFLKQRGITLIDCQVASDHLASLGAYTLPRATFIRVLRRLRRQKGMGTESGAWSAAWESILGRRVPVETLFDL